MNNLFEINISKQYWLGPQEKDLCSHGELYLNVNGTIITQPGIDEEWGISESALALLRTLKDNYTANPESEEGLILHGCGSMLMVGCPISIHWSVQHIEDKVVLSEFTKIVTTNPETGSIHYPELKIVLNKKEYEAIIISFATETKKFYEDSIEK